MKHTIVGFIMLALASQGIAQRNNWKPTDFEPLTSLPWEREGATMEQIIDRIFHEPNADVRYPVLGEYLRRIPAADFGKAFDMAIPLEGISHPDDLVSFMLRIWAQRDPLAAWEKTKALFKLVGFEEGWLIYDGWTRRPHIKVQDVDAIRASHYWLERRNTLASFPLGSITHRCQTMNEQGCSRHSPPFGSRSSRRGLEVCGVVTQEGILVRPMEMRIESSLHSTFRWRLFPTTGQA